MSICFIIMLCLKYQLTDIYVLSCLCKVFQVEEKTTALLFKAFSDENRIRILKMLKNGEKCACEILEELNVTQPTLSHHMKILYDSGIVISRKEGKWIYYSISTKEAKITADCLKELTSINWEQKKISRVIKSEKLTIFHIRHILQHIDTFKCIYI